MSRRDEEHRHKKQPEETNQYYRMMERVKLIKFRTAVKRLEDDYASIYGYQKAHLETLATIWISETDYSYIMEQWRE